MSKEKQKGTWFENKVVAYLAEKLGIQIERRALGGMNDKGDIAGVRTKSGVDIVIECKNHRTYAIPVWLKEARREAENAGGLGVVVFKAKGIGETRMGDQYVLMGLEEFAALIGEIKA